MGGHDESVNQSAFSEQFVQFAQRYLPSPFTIAVLLTFVSVVFALLFTHSSAENTSTSYSIQVFQFWEKGFWELLSFSMQMMLILILGHVIALTPLVNNIIGLVVRYCNTTARAAMIVTALAVFVGLLNWGLGLIFGAILARKVGEQAHQKGWAINYPLIGAAGYAGLMVWHGGLSGSAPATVAGSQHFLVEKMGVVPLSDTLFSPMNLVVMVSLLVLLPLGMGWLGKRLPATNLSLYMATEGTEKTDVDSLNHATPADKLDHSPWLARGLGALMLGIAAYDAVTHPEVLSTSYLNFINFVLFGLGVFLYGSFARYVSAVEQAITGASGILIQFPLYAGIMGIMKYSGLIDVFSGWMVAVSTGFTLPLWTLLSAGIVNVFVPSGGGQWAVQGPIVVNAANALQVPIGKMVMALSYGDQLTNMMQPFWALPLLGITRLSAQEILPYTLFLMLMGIGIYSTGLLLF